MNVRIVKLLPAVKLLRADDNQQFGRFPVHIQMSLDVVGIPAIEHFEQNFKTCWSSGLETLEFVGSEPNCHAPCSCAIAAGQKTKTNTAKISTKKSKGFRDAVLRCNSIRVKGFRTKIYKIHET